MCGDNVAESLEVCDGSDVRGATCADLGFIGGALACNATCNERGHVGLHRRSSGLDLPTVVLRSRRRMRLRLRRHRSGLCRCHGGFVRVVRLPGFV